MNKILSIALLVALFLTSVMLFATKNNAVTLPPDSASGVAQIGGAFTLTNQHGKKISDADFRGKYMLVFFGFTHCPDICPTTLATIASALPKLGDKAKEIIPIFISVDVKKDTPKRLKEFLASFDAPIVGLTGSAEEIKRVAAEYKAYYSETKKDDDEENEGGINHSTLIYLMDKEGHYITHFAYDITADQLAKKLSENMTK